MTRTAPLVSTLAILSVVLAAPAEAGDDDGLGPAPIGKAAFVQTVDQANRVAAEVLARHFGDHTDAGGAPLDPTTCGAALRFPRSRWDEETLRKNRERLRRGLAHTAGFLAQLAGDMGGRVDLHVLIVPDGELTRTAGVAHDSLYVPLGRFKEDELRRAYDEGQFYRADNWWSVPQHMAVAKKRALWQLTNKLRILLRQAARALVHDLDAAQGKRGDSLRRLLRRLVNRAVDPRVAGEEGGKVRATLLSRLDRLRDDELPGLLERWRARATNMREADGAAGYLAGALRSGTKITDTRDVWALVSVDTYDAISVVPDDVLSRHGAPVVSEVNLSGLRVALVHVSSVDAVTVVPNLARMLFGGVTLERALPNQDDERLSPGRRSSLREALSRERD